jgi:sec-independent protein translocase protein TatA
MEMTLFIIAGAIGPKELILIGIFLLVLFGGKKIPEFMRGLGQGIKEFKKSSKDEPQATDPQKKMDNNS